MEFEQAFALLHRYGQEQVLHYYDKLSDNKKAELLSSIDDLDLNAVNSALASQEKVLGQISTGDVLTLKEIKKQRVAYETTGVTAIRLGKVGAVLLAGGQGTRLGSDKPKGMFDIGETRSLTIFECLMNNLLDLNKKTGVYVHLFIMTSPATDAETRAYFSDNNYFGYDEKKIHFFVQSVTPAISFDGKILMEEKYRPVLSPNGNGGWFSALSSAGFTRTLTANGIEWLNVFGVDNVLQKICDPVFIGATISSKLACGCKVVKKEIPGENVGIFCKEDGASSIVEYYEMPDKLKVRRDLSGELVYKYGATLNYLFSVERVREMNKKKMPYHLAKKKINCVKGGKKFEPEEPNGYKIETLVVDMVKMSGTCLGFEVDRDKEFAPVKNLVGEDSVETARAQLKANGVKL